MVSEIVDVTLVGEGVLDTVCHAVTHLLPRLTTPDDDSHDARGDVVPAPAVLIPQAATLWVTAVSSPALRLGGIVLNATQQRGTDMVDLRVRADIIGHARTNM